MNANNVDIVKSGDEMWLSGTAAVMLIVLLLLRDACITATYQRQLVLFFDHQNAAKEGKATSREDIDYDALTAHDTDALLQGVHYTESNHKMGPLLYEDDHLYIFSKALESRKPKTLAAGRYAKLKWDGTPFKNRMFGQFLVAGLLYMLQLYVMYATALYAQDHVSINLVNSILAAVNLALPMGLMIASTMLFISDLSMLNKDHTEDSSVARAWNSPSFGMAPIPGVLEILYMFTTFV